MSETGIVVASASEFEVAINQNEVSNTKAKTYGTDLLARINSGMTLELDKAANEYLVRIRQTVETMQARRKPLTQRLDEIKSRFTALENDLDIKQPTTIPGMIQAARDKFAKDQAEKKRQEELEALKKANIAKEIAECKVAAEAQLRQSFSQSIDVAIKALVGSFNSINLSNHEQVTRDIIESFPVFLFEEFESYRPVLRPKLLDEKQIQACIVNAKAGKYEAFQLEYIKVISAKKQELIEKIPGKIQAMVEAQSMAEEERKKAELAMKQKAEEEAWKADQERMAREQKIAETMQRDTAVAASEALFDHAKTSVPASPSFKRAGTTKKGFEISVLDVRGYMEIFAFYMEKEGNSKTPDEIGGMKLDSMRKFCEKWAKDNGDQIESTYLLYQESTKTIAR